MDSSTLKAAALAWLRYGKRMPIVCSEVGKWNADVLGVSKSSSIEVEVKISKSDLKQEFKTKASKHYLYENCRDDSPNVPNYFYFMVPATLEEAACEVVGTNAPKAGIAIYHADSADRRLDHRVEIVKKPKKLKNGAPSRSLVSAAVLRASSELCGLYAANLAMRSSLTKLQEACVAASVRTTKALDYEDAEVFMLLRAMELALCVEGVSFDDFDSLSKEAKGYWLAAARKLHSLEDLEIGDWVNASLIH